MTAQEPGKAERKLGMRVQCKGSKRRSEFLAPADMKGTRVLTLSPVEMYVYLPSFGKVRRIASHVSEQGFLGRVAIAMAALVLLLVPGADVSAAAPPLTYLSASETGRTMRHWDCCKASGAWPGKAPVVSPIKACAKDGSTVVDANTQNACGGGGLSGPSYMCSSNQPWAVDANVSYGFAAARLLGKSESDWLCACYALQFTSGVAKGKTFVAQVVDTVMTGEPSNYFDLLVPGGGVGIFNGCQGQWGAPSDGWGARYGGVSSKSECSNLPTALRAGCHWRFDWLLNADNPTVTFRRVKCPTAITAKTGCVRKDE